MSRWRRFCARPRTKWPASATGTSDSSTSSGVWKRNANFVRPSCTPQSAKAGGAPLGRPVSSRVLFGTSGEYESMKSRETLIRLKKFQVDEKRRRVAQIEGMIADFQRMSVELEREIQNEQDRAGINDPSHFAYPTYAKAAIQRRENLTRSADELRIQLEDARSLLTEAFEELKRVDLRDERDQPRERAEESAREQADLDSIGLMRARIGAVA